MPWLSRNQQEQGIGRLGAGQSVQIIANAYNTTNSTNHRPHSGCPRVTTPWQGHFILYQHQQDWFTTTTETARHTTGTQQRPISANTVRRHLASNHIHGRRPARGPILTNHHQQEWLRWATSCQHWCYQQWRRILFSDESWFWILTVDGRVRVWRRKDEHFAVHVWCRETNGVGKASWFGEPLGSVIKLDLSSFRILSQVKVMASQLCSISIKSFDFTLCHPLSYFSFQPVLHDWCNKGRGMCYPVCGMVRIKEP